MDAMTTDAQKVENAYLDAIAALGDVIGIKFEYTGIVQKPSVDIDTIPASVLNAGYYAIEALACGLGILDPDTPTDPGLDVAEALAAWTRER